MKMLWTVFALFALSACDAVSSFEEMGKKQAAFNDLSLKELGANAQVGWNIVNGELAQITVIYNLEPIEQIAVGELEAITSEMVLEVFGKQPTVLHFGFQTVKQ